MTGHTSDRSLPGAEPAEPRVLIVVKGLGLGGAERLIAEQVRRGRDDGVTYTVAYAVPHKDHFVGDLRASGAEVVCLGTGRGRWPLALAGLLRRTRPDVVHVHSPLPAAVARVLVRIGVTGRRGRSALAYTEHNRWQAYRLPVRLLNAATMPLDDRTWSVSGEARSSVRPARSRNSVEVLHHGIDLAGTRVLAERQLADLEPLPGRGATVLIHVANRRPEKNHEHLIESFGRAASLHPSLHLWLVGQHLDDPAIDRAVESSGAADRITLLGYRSDVLGLLSASDALVLGSDHEGLPVAVMEALALGVPVVSTAVGGMPEAISDGVEGRLVAPRDVEALASAMVEVASEPDTRAAMGSAARARSSAFDAAAAVMTQVEHYRRVGRARR